MERATLEKRMEMLNDYLQVLLHSVEAEKYPKLLFMLLAFLEPGEYDKSSGPFAKTVESVVFENFFKFCLRCAGAIFFFVFFFSPFYVITNKRACEIAVRHSCQSVEIVDENGGSSRANDA